MKFYGPSLLLPLIVLLSGCATDAPAPERRQNAGTGAECVRRVGSNICTKHRDTADGVSDASAAELDAARRAAPAALPR